MTTQPLPQDFTADAFLAWAIEQPSGRYELVRGQVVAMAPERAGHARVKGAAYRSLGDAISRSDTRCEVFTDGMTVRIDGSTVYEPDALVRCEPRLPDEAVEVTNPVIVVEVISRSSRSTDSGAKLPDYFTLRSVAHYLVVNADTGTVTHHWRHDDGEISTRIARDGLLDLTPLGIRVDVVDLFSSPPAS